MTVLLDFGRQPPAQVSHQVFVVTEV